MDMTARYFSASDNKPATDDPRITASHAVNTAVRALGQVIEDMVPNGRQKSVALTELEGVQMRANRGIFSPESER